ncbi:uncharacterized protein LOC119587712 [Penaeus monodon]|uniref:uncharacterized protein LOC119587712 n=1 Tax=Penaeus monodon TaxID=6687 RepID=UPI0018A7AFE1|nr:uncharacterized protein LOC119587712 [Penaeus monodon]
MTLQEAARIIRGQRTSSGRSYYCQVCGAQFSIKSELKAHERREHGDSTEHRCASCNKVFSTAEVKSHTCLTAEEEERRNRLLGPQELSVPSAALASIASTPADDHPVAKEDIEGEDEDEEEEMHIPELPFKLPFKMDKKQIAVAMKLLKEAVKPILKSKALRETVAYLDDYLASYNGDIETQLYLRLVLDSAQDIYEGKEAGQIHAIVKDFFTDMSDEETARTIEDVWDYMSPTVDEWFYTPLRKYLVAPVRDYLYYPVSNAINDFADRIGRFMNSDYDSSYVSVQYPQYQRWSDSVNRFTNRISKWTTQARRSLETAARVLEAQDEQYEARACGGSCGSATLEEDPSDFAVQ